MTTDDCAEDNIGRTALSKASWRLLPLIALGYGIAYIDRSNISFASLQMNQDLHFSASVYGFGAGLFFLSYASLEVPSNLLLVRFGARRWIARIMLTWGVLAAAMMFVRSPIQFYVMRFLLGVAEAGFFPGAIYYLMQWFPAEYRGRAISRFYIAFPLSSAVMGAVAGPLLNLHGYYGLSGWQWLFLLEGLPAVVLGAVILLYLPESPAKAKWLTNDERSWILQRLAADKAALGNTPQHGLLRTLMDPRVLKLGFCNFCIMFSTYAFTFSAPAVLKEATRWDTTSVGLMMSLAALLGAAAMALNGWHSDRRRERYLHVVVPLALMASAFVVLGTSTFTGVLIAAYVLVVICTHGVQAAFWLIPSDALHGRAAAIAVAAIGSIGMIGAFIGPYAWGLAKDYTGSYQGGLLAVAVPFIASAVVLLRVRTAARSTRAVAALAADPAA